MSSNTPIGDETRVTLRPVSGDNWRDVENLKVTDSQREFVAEPSHYLALCCYGKVWRPLAIYLGERVIGFLMWAVDPADESCWLGGILIDQSYQRRGYGQQAIQMAMTVLAAEHGYQHFALSYSPDNAAQHLYHKLGFTETNEREGNEIVARLSTVERGAAGTRQ